MQSKLIAVAAAAYGALISWAVTADHYEQKLAARDDYIEVLRNRPTNVSHAYYDSGVNEPNGPWILDRRSEAQNGSDSEEIVRELSPEELAAMSNLESRLTSGEIEIVREADGTLRTQEVQTSENPRGDETSEADEAGGTNDSDEIPPGETPEQTRRALKDLIEPYMPDEDVQEAFVQRAKIISDTANTPPFVISRALFSSDPDEGDAYDKETLTYFPEQRVLIDSDEEVIDDINNVVGWKNLARFGDQSEDADCVFVRNRRLNTDYEVVRDEDSPLPLHVKYSMGKDEFNNAKSAGILKLRDEDR